MSVPRTDTGVSGQETQGGLGIIQARELGKLVPYVRNKGCLPSSLSGEWQVAIAREA